MAPPHVPKSVEQLEAEIRYYEAQRQRTVSVDRRKRAQTAIDRRTRQLAQARQVVRRT